MTNNQALLMFSYLSLLSEARKAREWYLERGMKPTTPPSLMPGAFVLILRYAKDVVGMDEEQMESLLDRFDAEVEEWTARPDAQSNANHYKIAIAREVTGDGYADVCFGGLPCTNILTSHRWSPSL
jgi:hypothetical protein